MNLQPLGDRLIVEVLEDEETTASGIVLPDTAKEKPQRGRVLAVGPGGRNDKGDVVPTNDAAGDGTTTATVLAQAIVREGLKNVAAGANPMALKRGIEKSVDEVSEHLKT